MEVSGILGSIAGIAELFKDGRGSAPKPNDAPATGEAAMPPAAP